MMNENRSFSHLIHKHKREKFPETFFSLRQNNFPIKQKAGILLFHERCDTVQKFLSRTFPIHLHLIPSRYYFPFSSKHFLHDYGIFCPSRRDSLQNFSTPEK